METKADGATEYPLRDPEPARLPVHLLVLFVVSGAAIGLGLALVFRLPAAPLVVAGAVGASCLAWVLLRRAQAELRAVAKIPRLCFEDDALVLRDGDVRTPIVSLDRRVGLTLLASPARKDLVLAITHRDGIEFVAGRAPSGTKHLDLLARAITTPENDMPIGDRVPIFGDGDRLLALAAALETKCVGAFDRVFLSDAGMADVVLDETRLRAGQLDFDLRAPLFWRAFGFQEGSSYASHTFQATQIRQGEREVVLVALAPTGELATPSLISPPPGAMFDGPLAAEAVQRSLARDLRLAHCLVDIPPARAARVAVDRLFMPRIRVALDLAPPEIIEIRRPSHPELMATPAEGVEPLRQSSPGR
ncbi:MAG: hypothetical protein ACXVEF_13820 [Polyangiales bacterium]